MTDNHFADVSKKDDTMIAKEDVRKFLLWYLQESLGLKGYYPPHEIISWIITDIENSLLKRGEQDD